MARTLKEARDEYNGLFEARNNAKEKAQKEGFDKLSEEERKAIKTYDERHTDLLEEIRVLTPDAANLNVNMGIRGNRDLSDKDEKDLGKFSLVKAFRQLGDESKRGLDGIEAEIDKEGRKVAELWKQEITGDFVLPDFRELRGQTVTGQTSNAGDQGGVTVETMIGNLIEMFWSNSVISKTGSTKFTSLQGNVTFPVQTSKVAISELTEIEEMTATEILFTDLDMTPKRRGVTVPYSKQFLLQSSLSVENFVREQILKAFNDKSDVEAITKILAAITSGNSNIVVGGTNGAAPTWANIVALESLIANADADGSGITYLTNSKVRGKLKTTEKFSGTNGMPVWGTGNTPLNEYTTVVSNHVPSNLTKGTASGTCSVILAGNFRDLYIGQWGVIDFIVDPYSLKKKAQVEVTANTFWDIVVARAASFSGMKDALTA